VQYAQNYTYFLSVIGQNIKVDVAQCFLAYSFIDKVG